MASKSKEAIKKVMEEQGVTAIVIARRISESRQNIEKKLSDRESKNGIRTDNLCKILKGIDYKLVMMPSDKKLPDGAIEIDDSEGAANDKE